MRSILGNRVRLASFVRWGRNVVTKLGDWKWTDAKFSEIF